MKFKNLHAENVYSFRNLDFEFNHRRGTTLIMGRNKDQKTANGAGKTAIIRTLYLGLWGQELYGAKLENVVFEKADNGYLIEVEFEDRGHEFKIVRFRGRKDREVSTGVDFYVDGKLFNGENATDTQKIIENKLKISPNLFLSAILTKQNATEHFLTANDSKKKEIFSELLDLIIYSKAFDLTKKEIESLEDKIGETSLKIEGFQERIKERTKEITDLEDKETKFEDEKTNKIKELESKKSKINQEITDLKNSNKELQELSAKETELKKKLEELKQKKINLQKSIEDEALHQEMSTELQSDITGVNNKDSNAREKLTENKKEYAALKKRKESPSPLEHKIDVLKGATEKVINAPADTISADLMALADAAVDVCGEFDTTNEDRIKELEVKEKELNQSLRESAEKKIKLLAEKKKEDDSLAVIRKNKKDITTVDDDAETTRTDIKEVQERKKFLSNVEAEVDSKNAIIKEVDTQIEEAKGKKNPYRELIESTKNKVNDFTELLNQNKKVNLTLDEELRYLSFWKGAFSPLGIRSFIFDEVVDLLNQKVQANLNDLFEGALSVVFESESKNSKGTTNNKIEAKIYYEGKEREYNLLSGGEQQRGILAVNLALTEIAESYSGTAMNIKFLDEPFTGIAGEGQVQCFKVFARLSQNKDGFFVVSHDPSFQELCPNAIYVIKENGESRIVSRSEFDPPGTVNNLLSFNQNQEES
jgi:DNA repair exonuclease SbcCD ATPase subunit